MVEPMTVKLAAIEKSKAFLLIEKCCASLPVGMVMVIFL
ncbi:hypothetical protein JCM19238_2665 [Vibrio ponticus]|nr:hypothetical protein JCM19238_2665 [Vibrio ponticus]